MKDIISEIRRILTQILEDRERRPQLISELQQLVWDNAQLDRYETILRDLAYDLDFYEPDETRRREEATLYDDDHLEIEVRRAMDELQSLPTSL